MDYLYNFFFSFAFQNPLKDLNAIDGAKGMQDNH